MRHLIVGNGVMGKKHGSILQKMGELVEYADLESKGKLENYQGYDSYLVCTPPDTHLETISSLLAHGKPIFCEKPLYTETGASGPLESILERSKGLITRVGCNWRYCDCLPPSFSALICSYPTANKLDLIHFIDLFWVKRPEILYYKATRKSFKIYGKDFPSFEIKRSFAITTRICNTSTRLIHIEPCNMFAKQMKTWLKEIHGEIKPQNPFPMAAQKTKFLLKLINE